jgi:hypothetical protein
MSKKKWKPRYGSYKVFRGWSTNERVVTVENGHTVIRVHRVPIWEEYSMGLRKPVKASGMPGDRDASDLEPFTFDAPTLVEFLSTPVYDDGTRRETGTILIFFEEGLWKCCVRDRDNGRVCFLSAQTLCGLLGRVSVGLSEDALDWRKEKPWGSQGGGKKRS